MHSGKNIGRLECTWFAAVRNQREEMGDGMQLILDDKLKKMDELYVKTNKLIADYKEFCAGKTKEQLQSCVEDIETLKGTCQGTRMDMEDFLENLRSAIQTPEMAVNSNQIILFLEQMQQKVQKAYLACMHNEESYRHVKLENYFGTAYEKRALIIYIVYPFLFPDASLGHTNQQEVKVMAELLRNRGYNVDIVNTRYIGEVAAESYDLIIGSGNLFEAVCGKQKEGAVFLYYLTEASPYFWNVAELKRLQDFYKRNHCRLPFERQAGNRLNLQALAKTEAAICIGNQWTVSTYEGMFPHIYPLDVSGFELGLQPEFGTYEAEMRKNFMWYGGAGPVHKGLDLCIEAFRSLPDLKLHIVGEPNAEFYNFYRKDIEEAENIYYYGFLNKDSEEFLQVCNTCAYCVSPSCGEGQSTSVLTSMFGGMIPVCTVETGIDLEKCGGIWIERTGIEDIAALLRKLSELPEEEVRQRRRVAYAYVTQNHTLANYRRNMGQILEDVLAQKEKGSE